MYVYVCMRVCMYVCMHMCVCVCVCLHVCGYACACACVCVYVCMCVCMYVCMGVQHAHERIATRRHERSLVGALWCSWPRAPCVVVVVPRWAIMIACAVALCSRITCCPAEATHSYTLASIPSPFWLSQLLELATAVASDSLSVEPAGTGLVGWRPRARRQVARSSSARSTSSHRPAASFAVCAPTRCSLLWSLGTHHNRMKQMVGSCRSS